LSIIEVEDKNTASVLKVLRKPSIDYKILE